MKTRMICAMVLMVCWAIPGWADIYSWVDNNGVRHFSNRPPENQQKATRTKEIPHDAAADALQAMRFKEAAGKAQQRQVQAEADRVEAERRAAEANEKERLAAEKERLAREAAAAKEAAEKRKSFYKRLRTRSVSK